MSVQMESQHKKYLSRSNLLIVRMRGGAWEIQPSTKKTEKMIMMMMMMVMNDKGSFFILTRCCNPNL
jgi:hypothetical protein